MIGTGRNIVFWAGLFGMLLGMGQLCQAASITWRGGITDIIWSSEEGWSNGIPPTLYGDDILFPSGPPPVSTTVAGQVNNVVDLNYVLSSLSYKAQSNSFHTTHIPEQTTLSVTGSTVNTMGTYVTTNSLFVGTGADNGGAAQVYATITGPGTLIVSNPAAHIDITQTSGLSGNKNATLDLAGLGRFEAYVNQLRVGNGASTGTTQPGIAGNRSAGTLILAQTNLIVCNSSSWGLSIGDCPQNNGPLSALRLGQTNAIFSDYGMVIGRRKSSTLPALTTLSFATNVTEGYALFRNKAGTGPMGLWTVGDNAEVGAVGSGTGGMIDLTRGVVDAWVNTVYVARTYNGNGTSAQNAQSIGVLTYGAGNITGNTLEIGYQNGNSGAIATGTVNVLERGTMIMSNDVRLARMAATTNGSATGTLIISGKVSIGGRIYDGGGVSSLTVRSGNSNVGTLDMQPPGDATAGSITLDKVVIDGGIITNASTIFVSTLFASNNAAIAGRTTIDLPTNSTFDVTGQPGGFTLGEGQTVQGSGTITGDFIQGPGATIIPGGRGIPGTLTHYHSSVTSQNNLTLSEGGNLVLDLCRDPSQIGGSNDLISVGGTLTMVGTNLVTLNLLDGVLGDGSYRIINHADWLSGDSSQFRITGPLETARRLLTFDTSTMGQVNLMVSGEPPATISWAGGTGGIWDLKNSYSWQRVGPLEMFYSLDSVVFNDSASISQVNLGGDLYPASVIVSNNLLNFTFGGSGGITGSGGLTKLGAGTLTVGNIGTNSFTGAINVGGGRLQLAGGADRLPVNATVNLSNAVGTVLDLDGLNQTIASLNGGGQAGGNVALGSGVLTVNGGGVFDGEISGDGRVVKLGAGTLQLAGSNTFTGGLTISTGTVIVANVAGSGTGLGVISLFGGTLQIGTNGVTGSIMSQPGGVLTNNGSLVFNRSDTVTFPDEITGSGSVRQTGSGTLIVNRNHSYTNTTTVMNNNGVMRISTANALGTTDGGTIVAGGNIPPPGAGGRLELAGGVLFAPEALTLACRGIGTGGWEGPAQFVNYSDTNTWTGPIDITTGGSWIALQSDSGLMRIQNSIAGGPTATGTRLLLFAGVANGEVVGAISNGPVTTSLSVGKKDSGTWTLWGNNTYNGTSIISNGVLLVNGSIGGASVTAYGGTLGGIGAIRSPVTIEAGATLAPGVASSVGVLTIGSSLTLRGLTVMDVVKAGATTLSDSVSGLTNLILGGTLVVNLQGAPVGGESFKLFESTAYSGAFAALSLPTLPGGLSWETNNLHSDGTLRIAGTALPPPQPRFAGINSQSGSEMVIRGTAGAAGGSYYVLTTTNMNLPVVNWTPIETNLFGPDGTFSFTNRTTPSVPQRFYLIQMP
jgi:autotransporter-associated beta strand protein